MKTNYILIDYENVPVKSLALLKGDHFKVKVFLGPKNTKLATEFVLAIKTLGDKADFIVLQAGGPNALDFHITYYLGKLIAEDPAGFYHIISKDTGFDGLVAHVQKTGVLIQRSASIEAMPCFAAVVVKPTTKAVTKPAAKSVTKPASVTEVVKPATTMKPATKKKADELVDKMVTNLTKLANGKPNTEKTLKGKIKNWCGSAYSDKEIDAVFARLLKKTYVVIEGEKLVYQLPDSTM
jgi:hypothetical protein